MFIDEFLVLLLMTSRSVDLVHLKTAVVQLLPHSLGKNALVEAELELKQQVEQQQVEYDFTSYEKMRTLTGQQFPQDQLISLLQVACADYCTLTSDDTNNNSKSAINNSNNVVIPPVVVIYVTAIVEHIAEYVLNSVAMTADGADAEHIRVQEVLVSLLEDPQLNNLFQRMNLKTKLEKRVSTHPTMNTNINSYSLLPTPTPSPVTVRSPQQQFSQQRRDSHTSNTSTYHQRDDYSPDISFNEFLESADDDEPRAVPSSIFSIRSSESFNDRPLSVMSNGTVKSSGSKSRFNFFGKKEKRSSISLNFSSTSSSKRSMGTSSAITSPTAPSFQSITSPISNDFDDLIRSGKTKKVSLTPNRLTSIEVKEDKSNEVTPWEKFNSSSTSSKPTRTKKRSTALPVDNTPPPPLPPLPRLHREVSQQIPVIPQSDSSPPLTPASSVASRPSQRSRHSIIYEERSANSLKSSSSHLDDLLTTEDSTSLKRNPSKMSNSSSLYSNNSSSRQINNNSSLVAEEENKAVKLRFERPSSMVMKRASMGSRPPSFHENVLMDSNGNMLLAAAAAAGSENSGRSKSSRINKKMASLDVNEEEPSMIYVVPSVNSRATIIGSPSRTTVNKPRTTMDRGCQTDPIPLHTLIQQHHHHHILEEEEEQEAEEEWFIEEEEWEDQAEEEKSVVDWLLGNA
ncbi:unnamed protein product [Mucor hiemalis]